MPVASEKGDFLYDLQGKSEDSFFIPFTIVQKYPRNTFIKIMNNYSFFLDNYLSESIIKIRIDRGL